MPIESWNYTLDCWLCKKRVAIAAESGVNPDAAPSFIYGRCPECGAELNLTPELLEPEKITPAFNRCRRFCF